MPLEIWREFWRVFGARAGSLRFTRLQRWCCRGLPDSVQCGTLAQIFPFFLPVLLARGPVLPLLFA